MRHFIHRGYDVLPPLPLVASIIETVTLMHGCWHHLAVMLEVQQDQSSLRAGCWTAGCGIRGTGNVENWSTGRPWASCPLLWLHWCTLDVGICISSCDMLQATERMEVLIHIQKVPREKTMGRCYLDHKCALTAGKVMGNMCTSHDLQSHHKILWHLKPVFVYSLLFSSSSLSQYNPIRYSMDTPLLCVNQVWVSP